MVVVMNQCRWLSATLASGVLSMALSGCVIVPDQRHYYADGVVMVAPPAAFSCTMLSQAASQWAIIVAMIPATVARNAKPASTSDPQ